jgi:hypothetical protein
LGGPEHGDGDPCGPVAVGQGEDNDADGREAEDDGGQVGRRGASGGRTEGDAGGDLGGAVIDYRRSSMDASRDDAVTWASWFRALGDRRGS